MSPVICGGCHCRSYPGSVGGPVGGEPAKSFQIRCLVDQRPDPLQDRIGGQRHLRAGIVGDRLDAGRRAVQPRRVRRHRDHAGIQAAEERRDEIEAGRVEEQRPLTLQALRLEPGPDGPGLPVELAVGQVDFLGFSVDQKRIGPVVRLAFCPLAQQVDQRGRSSRRIEESVLGMHDGSNSGNRGRTCWRWYRTRHARVAGSRTSRVVLGILATRTRLGGPAAEAETARMVFGAYHAPRAVS